MPARKLDTLNQRHDTKDDRKKRAAGEAAMTPTTVLPKKAPESLRGHKIATSTWVRVVGLYYEIEGKIATSFDVDLLVKYCLLEEEVVELASMRETMRKDWITQRKAAVKLKPTDDNYASGWEIANALFAKFQGMDARLDGKRKLLLAISQSLYLTPRSRAGVEPPMKEPEKPKSEMEGLL